MDIEQLLDATTDITFEFENAAGVKSSITAKVRTDSMTPGVLADISLASKNSDMDAMVAAISQFLVDWDLVYKGEPFEISSSNLRRIPLAFHMALVEAVSETWSGNEKRPSESQTGSARSAA